MPDEIGLHSNSHPDLNAYSTSYIDISREILVGRPYDSLSFMWRIPSSRNVKIKDYIDPKFLGQSLQFDSKSLLLLNVYLPSRGSREDDKFSAYFGRLLSIIEECLD